MARRIVAEFDAVTGPFLAKMDRIDQSITRFERGTLTSFGRVERGVNSLVSSASQLRNITGLIASGFGVNLATGFLDQAALIRNALREAGDESEATFNKVFQSSVRALAGFRDTAQGVQRFQKALGDRQNIDASIRQLETLNKLLALGGKTTQERQSTFIQFSQALQAGVLQGEELRSVRENAPIELSREIARVAGGSIEDLKKFAEQGLLTTEVMVEALKNLEKEADRRFKQITVTIQDGAKILQSGAIVALEGFDRGLGFSRTTVAGLKVLGETLGESGEAAERFGEAVKVAGAILVTAFAGRRIQDAAQGMQALSAARLADAAAAERQFAAAQRELVAAQTRAAATNTALASLTAQGAAARKVATAQTAQQKAVRSLIAAETAHAAALNAANAAQNRLLLSTRALGAAGSVLRGAWAFLGGWPGLILAAGTAFLLLRDRAESTAQGVNRLRFDSTDLGSVTENVTDAYKALGQAIREAGDEATATSQKLVAASARELQAQKLLLQAEVRQDQRTQAERVRFANTVRQRIRELEARRQEETSRLERDEQGTISGVPTDARQIRDTIRAVQQQYDALIRIEREGLAALEVEINNAAAAIQAARRTLLLSEEDFSQPDYVSEEELEAATKALESFVQSTRTAAERQKATLAEMAEARGILVKAYGEESEQVAALDDAMARFRSEMDSTRGATDELTNAAIRLRDALSQIGTVRLNLDDRLSNARQQIAALERGAAENEVRAVPDAAAAAREVIRAGGNFDQAAAAYQEILDATRATLDAEERAGNAIRDAFAEPSGGGAGGGGGRAARQTDLIREATDLIEQGLSAQERQAAAIAKAVQLREQLLRTYPNEVALIARVDETITRLKDEYDELGAKNDEFWDSLSQQIAGAITDWTNLGDVVRRIAADVVGRYGPGFFQALFSGSSPGQAIAAAVQHDGSRNRRRMVSPSLFAGAPKLHNGLRADEYPAILQRGETVIPKSMGGRSGAGPTIVMHNDFSNADPSMKPWLEQQLARMNASFEARFVATARKMGNARVQL